MNWKNMFCIIHSHNRAPAYAQVSSFNSAWGRNAASNLKLQRHQQKLVDPDLTGPWLVPTTTHRKATSVLHGVRRNLHAFDRSFQAVSPFTRYIMSFTRCHMRALLNANEFREKGQTSEMSWRSERLEGNYWTREGEMNQVCQWSWLDDPPSIRFLGILSPHTELSSHRCDHCGPYKNNKTIQQCPLVMIYVRHRFWF